MNTPPTIHNTLLPYWHKLQSFTQSKAFIAMFWVLLGNGGSQFIRLLGNLILTQLLFPEAFGIMAIVHAIIVGLNLLSDVGLREGVVNSSRIDDPIFMQTAWTLQIVRQVVIVLFLLILAYPISIIYKEPILFPILCASAVAVFATGFKSIALLAYDKRMDLRIQIIADLSTMIFGILVTIAWAAIWPSIWALVGGFLVTAVFELFLSYRLFQGHFSKLTWDKETALGLFHFGKWILISSAISYITLYGDKLIMGSLVTMAELGLYSIASTWAGLIAIISYDFSRRVLHPYFRDKFNRNSGYGSVRNIRLLLNSAYLTICILLAIFGDLLIAFLYDDRWLEAGWMLQLLAIGQIGRGMSGTLMPFLLAKGDSFSQMTASVFGASILVTLVLICGFYFGSLGIIVSYALTGLLVHPLMIFLCARHGYNCALDDSLFIVLGLCFVFTCWVLMDSPILQVLSRLTNWMSI